MTKSELKGRIGLLEVLEKYESKTDHKVMYRCKCECGNVSAYEQESLLKGECVACELCRTKVENAQMLKEMQISVVKVFEDEALINDNKKRIRTPKTESLQLSNEQKAFIDSALEGTNILVDACIGSGKTTAIQELCNKLPDTKAILYLTYNKLLKCDAQAKIKNKNVTVTNYHGFAHSQLMKNGISVAVSDLIQTFNREKPDIPFYDVLVIDEYQDIEQELAELLELVKAVNPEMQIIAVGDMQQKIYDKTTLDVASFIVSFLGKYKKLEFTKCFRLSQDLAAMLGRVWKKKIEGVNSACIVEEKAANEVMRFLAVQNPSDILCLGKRNGIMSDMLNVLEGQYPEKYNKNTVYASIADNDSGATTPRKNSAIFTTYDSSKGLERPICVIFDFTEDYWERRIDNPQQDYTILRNIFCVAASRGKSHIIFVKDKEEFLSEKTLSTYVEKRNNLKRANISEMFDFKYKENVETCYKLLSINKINVEDTSVIDVKNTDGLIDLSPCIGIYQEASFFEKYDIDKDIELYLSFHREKRSLFSDDIRTASFEKKVLFLVSLETNQERYLSQVQVPFIQEEQKIQLRNRLCTVFNPSEEIQKECVIPFNFINGNNAFTAEGRLDVLKNDIVYELKFVSELKHEHFLQCACYMIAQNKERGILWNTKNNSMFEICIPDRNVFLEEVAKTVSKNSINITNDVETIAVIDTETTFSNKVMSLGVAVANSDNYQLIESRYYIFNTEASEGGIYSSVIHMKNQKAIETTREYALNDLIRFLTKNNVTKLFAYNASFDKNHLPELDTFEWYDIMRIAAYKQYNSKISEYMECTSTGRLKSNYGVEPMMRLLSGNKSYVEIHNAETDAIDELKIMRLLNCGFSDYKNARISKGIPVEKENTAFLRHIDSYKQPEHTGFDAESNPIDTIVKNADINNGEENTKSSINTTCSVNDAADLLGVSKSTVYNLIRDGHISAYKKGNKYIVNKVSVFCYLEELEQQKKSAMNTASFTKSGLIVGAVSVIIFIIFLLIMFNLLN